ncbi:pseudaminic acid synthase, partial [Bacteroidota bacterium]
MALQKDNKVFIIAELSSNHNQQKEVAIKTIKAAKKAGADAIKLQTYTPDTMTIDCDNDYFQIKEGLWKGKNLYDLYKEAYTPWEWHADLFQTAKEEGLICFSTPFDKTAVDFLETLNNPIYKIASFEIQDIHLIKYAASKGKPMIISTGIAELEDINLAVKTCREAGNNDITLLKCTSSYPAPIEEANLATIPNLKETFGVNAGLSDHTLGITVPVVATTLGATVIEKHFILDKSIGGPDVEFSLDLDEFSAMVKAIREAEKAIGKINYGLGNTKKTSKNFGRSLIAVKDIKKGVEFTKKNV